MPKVARKLASVRLWMLAWHIPETETTYATSSQAVAYRSMYPPGGPRLLYISLAYAEHMLNIPRLHNELGITPTTRQNPLLQNTVQALVQHMPSID